MKIVFGGGCFWCTEAVFKMLNGVTAVEPGYAGDTTPNPTYHDVAMGETGHAEVVQITYDPSNIRLEDLLSVFFGTHDPTSLNRQGNDIGTEYRSVIFYETEGQKETSERYIANLNASVEDGKPIVTEMKPLDQFYAAESSHQDYYERNKEAPYCKVIINPKLKKAKKQFARLLKSNHPSDS